MSAILVDAFQTLMSAGVKSVGGTFPVSVENVTRARSRSSVMPSPCARSDVSTGRVAMPHMVRRVSVCAGASAVSA